VADIDLHSASSSEVYESIATMEDDEFAGLMDDPESRARVIDALADHMAGLFRPEKAGDLDASIHVKLWDKPGGGYDHFELRILDGKCAVVSAPESEPDLTIKVRPTDLRDLITGRSGPKRLAFKGRLRAIGDIRLGMRLPGLFAFDQG
jgi:putative sterol carrier protein